jgi:hypothetical protein
MKARSLVLSLSVVSLTLSLDAQTIVPPSATSTLGGSSAGFPFSYTGYTRFQQAVDKSYLKVGFIYGISFRSTTRVLAVKERQWQEMRVVLADLTASKVSGLGGTFANNLGTNQLEVFRGKFNIYRPNPSDSLEFSVTIPFEKPFLCLATSHLVIDLLPVGQGYEQWPGCGRGGNGTSMDGTMDIGIYSALGKGSCTTIPTAAKGVGRGGFVMKLIYTPMLMPFGKGCKGSNGKIPQIGSSGSATLGGAFTFTMSDAPTNSKNSVFLVGLSNLLDGPTRLPFNLSVMTNGKGCWQNTDALLIVFLPVTAGKATLPVTIPNSAALKGLHVYSQFAVDDPTLGGFTVTQGGVIRPQ